MLKTKVNLQLANLTKIGDIWNSMGPVEREYSG